MNTFGFSAKPLFSHSYSKLTRMVPKLSFCLFSKSADQIFHNVEMILEDHKDFKIKKSFLSLPTQLIPESLMFIRGLYSIGGIV